MTSKARGKAFEQGDKARFHQEVSVILRNVNTRAKIWAERQDLMDNLYVFLEEVEDFIDPKTKIEDYKEQLEVIADYTEMLRADKELIETEIHNIEQLMEGVGVKDFLKMQLKARNELESPPWEGPKGMEDKVQAEGLYTRNPEKKEPAEPDIKDI